MTVWIPPVPSCGNGGGPAPGWPAFGWVFSSGNPVGLPNSDVHLDIVGQGYPKGFTNPAGDSVTAGFVGTEPGVYGNQSGAADKRFSGYVAQGSGTSVTWRVDVDADDYDISLCFCNHNGSATMNLGIVVNGSTVHSWVNGAQTGLSVASGFGAKNNTEWNSTNWYTESNHIQRVNVPAAGYIQIEMDASGTFTHFKSLRLTRV